MKNEKKMARNVAIATEAVSNPTITQKELADKYDLSIRQIQRILTNEESKAIAQHAYEHNLLKIDDALNGHDEIVNDKEHKDRLAGIKLRYDVVGITAPHPSIFVQNILNIQGNVTLSPRMQSLLTQHPDIIDVTPYNDTSKSQLANNSMVLDAEMVD